MTAIGARPQVLLEHGLEQRLAAARPHWSTAPRHLGAGLAVRLDACTLTAQPGHSVRSPRAPFHQQGVFARVTIIRRRNPANRSRACDTATGPEVGHAHLERERFDARAAGLLLEVVEQHARHDPWRRDAGVTARLPRWPVPTPSQPRCSPPGRPRARRCARGPSAAVISAAKSSRARVRERVALDLGTAGMSSSVNGLTASARGPKTRWRTRSSRPGPGARRVARAAGPGRRPAAPEPELTAAARSVRRQACSRNAGRCCREGGLQPFALTRHGGADEPRGRGHDRQRLPREGEHALDRAHQRSRRRGPGRASRPEPAGIDVAPPRRDERHEQAAARLGPRSRAPPTDEAPRRGRATRATARAPSPVPPAPP